VAAVNNVRRPFRASIERKLSPILRQVSSRLSRLFTGTASILVRAATLWGRHDCVDLSAAFAYHTLQSFFPILLIVLAIASRLLGNDADLVDRILELTATVMPPGVLGLVESTLRKLIRQGNGAGLLGLLFLLITAANAYLSLQRGADRLWSAGGRPPGSRTFWQQLKEFLYLRLEAFAVVATIGILVVAEQILANLRHLSGVSWVTGAIGQVAIPAWLGGRSLLTSLLTCAGYCVLLSVLMRLLPSRTIPWRALIPGAIFTGVSITVLNSTLTRSLLSLGSRYQAYGVVGGVLLLTLWVWILGVILYFGQCLSVVLNERQTPDGAGPGRRPSLRRP
jgi:membrane protein